MAARTSSTLASSLLRRPFEGEMENDDDNMSVGLSNLESFLVLNRSRVTEWVEHQKALVDAQAEQHRQAALAEQNQLDRLHQNLLALQLDRSLCLADANEEDEKDEDETTEGEEGTTTHQRLVKEQEQVEEDLERVQALSRDKRAEIEDLEVQIVQQKERLLHDQEWKESIRESKVAAEAELNRCLDKFRNLGLTFDATTTAAAAATTTVGNESSQPAHSNALRFAFTLLDKNDPDRRFEFTLATTEDDGIARGSDGDEEGSYELVDCDPILADREDELDVLVKALNETDDMADFIRTLRQMFVEALAGSGERAGDKGIERPCER